VAHFLGQKCQAQVLASLVHRLLLLHLLLPLLLLPLLYPLSALGLVRVMVMALLSVRHRRQVWQCLQAEGFAQLAPQTATSYSIEQRAPATRHVGCKSEAHRISAWNQPALWQQGVVGMFAWRACMDVDQPSATGAVAAHGASHTWAAQLAHHRSSPDAGPELML
jgi:hypothetical protein